MEVKLSVRDQTLLTELARKMDLSEGAVILEGLRLLQTKQANYEQGWELRFLHEETGEISAEGCFVYPPTGCMGDD